MSVSNERILHLWETRVGDPTPSRPLTDADKLLFGHAVLALAESDGDERRHIICLCPDCTKPREPSRIASDGSASNLVAYKLGQIASATAKHDAGDYIDRGLILLRLLKEGGFAVHADL